MGVFPAWQWKNQTVEENGKICNNWIVESEKKINGKVNSTELNTEIVVPC